MTEFTEFDLVINYDFEKIQEKLNPKSITGRVQKEKAEVINLFCDLMIKELRDKRDSFKDHKRKVPYDITISKIKEYKSRFKPYDPKNNLWPSSTTHELLDTSYGRLFNKKVNRDILEKAYLNMADRMLKSKKPVYFERKDVFIPDETRQMEMDGTNVIILNEEGKVDRERKPKELNPEQSERQALIEEGRLFSQQKPTTHDYAYRQYTQNQLDEGKRPKPYVIKEEGSYLPDEMEEIGQSDTTIVEIGENGEPIRNVSTRRRR